eukprot:scaffold104942_cov18-Tisochrysis_lutea.AAC.1
MSMKGMRLFHSMCSQCMQPLCVGLCAWLAVQQWCSQQLKFPCCGHHACALAPWTFTSSVAISSIASR